MDKKKIILILGFAGFVAIVDNWVVSTILPSISQNLNVDIASASIVITAYMLPFGLFQLLYGYLAERFGKRQVITFAISMFTIATALCAFAVAIPDFSTSRFENLYLIYGIGLVLVTISVLLVKSSFKINLQQK